MSKSIRHKIVYALLILPSGFLLLAFSENIMDKMGNWGFLVLPILGIAAPLVLFFVIFSFADDITGKDDS